MMERGHGIQYLNVINMKSEKEIEEYLEQCDYGVTDDQTDHDYKWGIQDALRWVLEK